MKKGGRILIIDDNPKNVQLLANILHARGYEIEVGLSGDEALNWMQDETFDLLLLDVMMPKINGYHVCKEIRKNKIHDDMPIIFISAKTDKNSIVKGFEAGGQDYVTKPFNEEELMARVSTQIGLKTSKEELTKMNLVLEEKVKERTQELSDANERLVEIDKKRNRFLSFIGKEVRAPVYLMEKSLKAMQMSAESSHLAGLLTDLNLSYVKLKRITALTNKMVKIHNETFANNLNEVDLLTVVDMVLTNQDALIENKELLIRVDVEEGSIVKTNYDLLLESLNAFISLIGSYGETKSLLTVKFSVLKKQSILQVTGNFNAINDDYIEEMGLYASYSELIMQFLDGGFTQENTQNNEFVFNWIFN